MKIHVISSHQKVFRSLRDIPFFYSLLRYMIVRDFIVRYRYTFLGVGWSLFRPLLQIGIYGTLSFLINRNTGGNHAWYSYIYTSAGIIVWQMISSIIQDGSQSLLQNSSILTKVYFPRIILPFSMSVLPVIDFILSFIVLLVVIQFLNIPFHFHAAGFIFSLLILYILSLSFSLFLSVWNVFFRDIKLLLPYFMQILFFSLPVFIEPQVLENVFFHKYPWIRALYYANPFVYPLMLFKGSLVEYPVGWEVTRVMYVFSATLFLLVLSVYYFLKKERKMVEYI